MKKPDISLKPFFSGALVVESSETINRVDFTPDYWQIVCTGSAGVLYVYPSIGLSEVSFRLSSTAILKLPMPVSALTIKTVGLSGRWEIYAVKGLDKFEFLP